MQDAFEDAPDTNTRPVSQESATSGPAPPRKMGNERPSSAVSATSQSENLPNANGDVEDRADANSNDEIRSKADSRQSTGTASASSQRNSKSLTEEISDVGDAQSTKDK